MAWYKKGGSIKYSSPNFIKIVDFYLFNCPVENVSKRAKTFKDRGITKNRVSQLKRQLESTMPNIFFTENGSTVDSLVDGFIHKNKIKIKSYEIVACVKNTDIGETKTIFNSIRNALAHGSFLTHSYNGDIYYSFETEKNSIIKSRIRLKESTLLKWIKAVDSLSKK